MIDKRILTVDDFFFLCIFIWITFKEIVRCWNIMKMCVKKFDNRR